jgi:GxxExxY protein
VFESIILEVKAKSGIIEEHEIQTLNYIACAKMHLGIVANFGAKSFQQKRIVL